MAENAEQLLLAAAKPIIEGQIKSMPLTKVVTPRGAAKGSEWVLMRSDYYHWRSGTSHIFWFFRQTASTALVDARQEKKRRLNSSSSLKSLNGVQLQLVKKVVLPKDYFIVWHERKDYPTLAIVKFKHQRVYDLGKNPETKMKMKMNTKTKMKIKIPTFDLATFINPQNEVRSIIAAAITIGVDDQKNLRSHTKQFLRTRIEVQRLQQLQRLVHLTSSDDDRREFTFSHDEKWMNFNDYGSNNADNSNSNSNGNIGILYLYRIENFEPILKFSVNILELRVHYGVKPPAFIRTPTAKDRSVDDGLVPLHCLGATTIVFYVPEFPAVNECKEWQPDVDEDFLRQQLVPQVLITPLVSVVWDYFNHLSLTTYNNVGGKLSTIK